MKKTAFTMIELVFVIVVMGIIGKFGFEFLAQAYNNYIYSSINNSLQAKSEMAVDVISARLQYRIKDSVIARNDAGDFTALPDVKSDDYKILEWIGYDIDGFRGTTKPYWSGIIDLNNPETNATQLFSPETNTTELNELIKVLSYGGSNINDSALYFIGSNTNIKDGYGWDGTPINDQTKAMHPIRADDKDISLFKPIDSNGSDNNFSGVDVYEYYQLAWSAYAVVLKDGDLVLYYDYQPWQGESYSDKYTKHSIIMQNVSTFQFMSAGSVMKIQVCVKTDLVEDYSLCKEKTIF